MQRSGVRHSSVSLWEGLGETGPTGHAFRHQVLIHCCWPHRELRRCRYRSFVVGTDTRQPAINLRRPARWQRVRSVAARLRTHGIGHIAVVRVHTSACRQRPVPRYCWHCRVTVEGAGRTSPYNRRLTSSGTDRATAPLRLEGSMPIKCTSPGKATQKFRSLTVRIP